MTYRFLNVSITPTLATIDVAVVENRLNDLGKDWLRHNAYTWSLWTNKSAITVSEMLANDLEPDDNLIVYAMDTREIPTGRLPLWMWEWYNRPRNLQTGEVSTSALPTPSAINPFDPASLFSIGHAHGFNETQK